MGVAVGGCYSTSVQVPQRLDLTPTSVGRISMVTVVPSSGQSLSMMLSCTTGLGGSGGLSTTTWGTHDRSHFDHCPAPQSVPKKDRY